MDSTTTGARRAPRRIVAEPCLANPLQEQLCAMTGAATGQWCGQICAAGLQIEVSPSDVELGWLVRSPIRRMGRQGTD
jgi:hypothetical protein